MVHSNEPALLITTDLAIDTPTSTAPDPFTGLDEIATTLNDTMNDLQHRFDDMTSKNMQDIRNATSIINTGTKTNLRIHHLQVADQAKSAQIDNQGRRILALEEAIAAKGSALTEKDDELAAKAGELTAKDGQLAKKNDDLADKEGQLELISQQLQQMTEKCESLQQQLRKRPATPISSNRVRLEPSASEAATVHTNSCSCPPTLTA
ncbi:hypothetical protein KC332_g5806 [Hortaea werneckii]|uniref:Uncharacterized protein n=1 Tax=Hortaea werneckii TaxID=91943 RepID=A0A3M7J2D1_HORWE|nr:hypothetical protein KC358_g5698 [Hortaea werneckii]KAI6936858.1 hypothetical protein KC348_g5890 [Hortaea werneckii]KAI6937496.1 hypothetical protein KC341_g5528 [Hortaea werneckii]KAI6973064.1 hypothetical protein KC321_g5879 [Hortaea werneckii]KAI6987784.1 hypothetical protein KC329_g5792 [Hortaea werneckii]